MKGRWAKALCGLLAVLGQPLAAMATGHSFGERCARARAGRGVVRILHFGDSHLAGGANLYLSQFFQAQYGAGGPGLGLPWVCPMAGVSARASLGWRKHRKAGGDGRLGLGGAYLETTQAGEHADLHGAFKRFRLHLLKDPAGGKLAVWADGAPLGEVDLLGQPGQLAVFDRELPVRPGARHLELRTTRTGPVRILGIALEQGAGAIYSPLAFNGASAAWLGSVPEALFQAEVAAEAPDLVILAFGTNEANGPNFDPELYQKNLVAILDRFQKAAPAAALLLAGPPDGQLPRGKAGALARVVASQRAAASAFGGLFLDQRQVMGGAGSIGAWFQSGLANRDLIHLTPPGYRRLSQSLVDCLLSGSGLPPAALAAEARFMGGRAGGSMPALTAGEPAAAAGEEHHRIYTVRKPDGGWFITDDPAKVAEQAARGGQP